MSEAGISSRLLHTQQENINPNVEAKTSNARPSSAKTKLQQLGDYYSGNSDQLSSPIHKSEEKILVESAKNQSGQVKCRLGR